MAIFSGSRIVSKAYIPKAQLPNLSGKVRFRFENRGYKVINYMAKWERMFLYRAGAAIRTYTTRSFKRRKDRDTASTPGTAPFIHDTKAGFIRQAIMFAVNLTKATVMVGTRYSVAGWWGAKHEHGGRWKVLKHNLGPHGIYVKRPFMSNAFKRWQKYGLPTIMRDTKQKVFGD